jgi:hypothetical protein
MASRTSGCTGSLTISSKERASHRESEVDLVDATVTVRTVAAHCAPSQPDRVVEFRERLARGWR